MQLITYLDLACINITQLGHALLYLAVWGKNGVSSWKWKYPGEVWTCKGIIKKHPQAFPKNASNQKM